MEKYNFELWPLKSNELDLYEKRTCQI